MCTCALQFGCSGRIWPPRPRRAQRDRPVMTPKNLDHIFLFLTLRNDAVVISSSARPWNERWTVARSSSSVHVLDFHVWFDFMFAYVVWFFIYVDFQKCGFSRSACVNLMDLLGYTYRNTEYDFNYLRIVKMNHEDDIVGKIYSYFFLSLRSFSLMGYGHLGNWRCQRPWIRL
jgi:hypothetical protein